MTAKRVLVVEDEAIISMSLEDMLTDAGFLTLGPAGSVAAALALIEDAATIDCALLDVNLRGETVYRVADALAARDVPFAFTTGYGEAGVAARYHDRSVFQKPIKYEDVLAFVQRAAAGPS